MLLTSYNQQRAPDNMPPDAAMHLRNQCPQSMYQIRRNASMSFSLETLLVHRLEFHAVSSKRVYGSELHCVRVCHYSICFLYLHCKTTQFVVNPVIWVQESHHICKISDNIECSRDQRSWPHIRRSNPMTPSLFQANPIMQRSWPSYQWYSHSSVSYNYQS